MKPRDHAQWPVSLFHSLRQTTFDGKRCQWPTSYGTHHLGEAVCHLHCDLVHKDRDKTKAEFLLAYDEFKVQRRACKIVGVTERVIQVWRKLDEEFNAAVSALQASLDERRTRAVEESMWERAVAGDASAAEVLFWLANRAPDRWQDLKKIQHSVHHGGGVLMIPAQPDGDWSEIAQRQHEKLTDETGTGGRLIEAQGSAED